MSRSRHTEAQIITALKPVEAGRATEDVARNCDCDNQQRKGHCQVAFETTRHSREHRRTCLQKINH
jgi:hypothetical protein